MNGSKFEYRYGVKGNWRRTIHNRIIERLFRPARESLVLYLAGEDDLDRAEFLRRGFKAHNLVCVEKNADVASQLRKNGKLCIHGDVQNVILSWRNMRVDVLLLDFCCGLEKKIFEILSSLKGNNCFSQSVVILNLMRGRDKSSEDIRALYSTENGTKHRSKIFRLFYNQMLRVSLNDALEQSGICKSGIDKEGRLLSVTDEEVLEMMSVWETSYRSTSGQYFDSTVFKNYSFSALSVHAFAKKGRDELIKKYYEKLGDSPLSSQDFESYKRKISAHYYERLILPMEDDLNADSYLVSDVDMKNQISAIKATRTRLING